MGLDQYIFHVTKTHYDEQHTFNRSDLSDHVLIPAGEIDLPMYAGLKPYCQKLKVLNEYYDVAKMRADHGLSDDAFIWRYTADSITIGEGKHDVEIDDETVRQKYTSITCRYNGRIYIGQSQNISYRWEQHLQHLRAHTHHSHELQADFDHYGEQGFLFNVLLISGVEAERKALEKNYIAALCTTRYGYNTVC